MLKRVPIIIFILLIFFYYFKDDVFTSKEIKIGSSLPKTGITKDWGKSVVNGANAYFKFANENKILGDKTIKFITYDDKYEPELTQENIKRLVYKEDIYALFGLVGTPTVKSILPILEDNHIPLFAPFTGASFLRDTRNENIINFRTSYQNEIETIIEYLYKKKNLTKFAVFYQNDDYGEEGYVSIIQSLEKRKLSLSAEGTYKRNTLSISHAFNEIKDAKPEVIMLIGANRANALFIKKAKENDDFKNTFFCTISFGDANATINELKKLNSDTSNLLFSQVVPHYDNTNIEEIKQYQKLMKKYYPNEELGFISLEAFLAAKVLVNSLNRIKGERTRDKLVLTLKTTYKSLFDGIDIQYKNNQLLNKVYLFEYDNKFKEIDYEK
ncbi:ABC transporter substrate-binding protein [Malaciobacter pacificus]|uniref:Putative extracellular ligand-binding protein n=1 Tax=Malaciobacter pacificus TaxID=1080223 RepID=A0A5C2H710_9BACT|nr:ABC transporter substrate-binding protein [Malaciobacter pacificus]QEP34099.1 putative extracellular ligand-binding protein [Malaciobacter pacificus]GGD40405.1 ABC transporter substrate-binding protein [Malaciobacter pacificus]